jgi:hypothetical protein
MIKNKKKGYFSLFWGDLLEWRTKYTNDLKRTLNKAIGKLLRFMK